MPSSTFNEHPVTLAFSPQDGSGLSITAVPGDPPTIIPTSSLICLLRTDSPHTYTLLHQTPDSAELIRTRISHPPAALLSYLLLPAPPAHLIQETTVIVSTASGNGSATSYCKNILAPLLEALNVRPPKVVHTTSSASIASTASQLLHGGTPHTVILLAGDTGVHDAVSAVAGSGDDGGIPITLAVFPLGTGNALVSSYHTSRGIPPLRALLFGTPKPLPTFTATFSPGARWVGGDSEEQPCSSARGAVVASWGFHASLVADAELLRDPYAGLERFQFAAKQNLQPPLHAYRGTVSLLPASSPPSSSTDARVWTPLPRKEHFYVLATLCSNLEAALTISPASVPGEHMLRLVHFPPPPPLDASTSTGNGGGGEAVMGLMQAAYQGGKHVDDPWVGYEATRGIRIEIAEGEEDRWRRVCVDGRIAVLPERGWVEVVIDDVESRVRLVWAEE